MVTVFAWSVVDHEFEPKSHQTKDYKICICCFPAKHAAPRIKSKDWLPWNQNNASDGAACLPIGLLFQCWSGTKRTTMSFH